MPEGNFVLLVSVERKDNLKKLIAFVEGYVSDLEAGDSKDGYHEFVSDSMLEFSAYDFLKANKPLLEGKDWVRVYAYDEYDQEEFWYVDTSTHWVNSIYDGVSPTEIVSIYSRWHSGLSDETRYGCYSQEELQEFLLEHGSYNTQGVLINEGEDDASDEIKVRNASKKWDWYIPDHESLAKKIAANHLLPPDNCEIEFRRTFKIKDCLGYVWSWKNNGEEIYLFFMCLGLDMFYQRGFVNRHNFTMDQVISYVYKGNSVVCSPYPEGCLICHDDIQYLHCNLDSFDDGLLSNNLRAFKGKVVSGYGLYLTRRNKQYFLSTEKLNESDNRVWEIVDAGLDEKLKKHVQKPGSRSLLFPKNQAS